MDVVKRVECSGVVESAAAGGSEKTSVNALMQCSDRRRWMLV